MSDRFKIENFDDRFDDTEDGDQSKNEWFVFHR